MSSRIPTINFSDQELKPDSPEWDSLKVQVREALEEYGCFEATFEQVQDLRKPVFGAMEQLFDLPLQTKQLCVPKKNFRGYLSNETTLFESMPVEEQLTNILWPQGNTSFSEIMKSFSELVSGLEKIIMRMILESFGLEKYLDDLINSRNNKLRVMKYRRPETNIEPIVGVGAHRDPNFMTILYQNEVDGLEIQSKDDEWIVIKPSPNSLVVMIGESLSVWLNGRLSSPYHRVITTGNKARYSVGLFAAAREGCLVKVPGELIDKKNKLLFKPFYYEEFMGVYHAHIARGVKYGLKEFCSV